MAVMPSQMKVMWYGSDGSWLSTDNYYLRPGWDASQGTNFSQAMTMTVERYADGDVQNPIPKPAPAPEPAPSPSPLPEPMPEGDEG